MKIFFIQCLLLTIILSQPFTQLQTLTSPSSWTDYIDISYDNRIISIANRDHRVYIYTRHNNSTIFSIHQTIGDSSSEVYVADLTGDGKMLLVVEESAWVKIYSNINNRFTLLQVIIPMDEPKKINTVTTTDDHEWVVFGTWSNVVEIYKHNGIESTKNQKF